MGSSLGLVILLLVLVVIAILIAGRNRARDSYADLSIAEWDCPTCGFHVQAGDTCIYCGEQKAVNG